MTIHILPSRSSNGLISEFSLLAIPSMILTCDLVTQYLAFNHLGMGAFELQRRMQRLAMNHRASKDSCGRERCSFQAFGGCQERSPSTLDRMPAWAYLTYRLKNTIGDRGRERYDRFGLSHCLTKEIPVVTSYDELKKCIAQVVETVEPNSKKQKTG